ncbi:hypothetical protein [Aeoliella sp. SH292]|uniref:hypothetical protein n=1 Tax=Aeoliella sp. SH292 TaxID=3454464 RepID=UPI003F9B1511
MNELATDAIELLILEASNRFSLKFIPIPCLKDGRQGTFGARLRRVGQLDSIRDEHLADVSTWFQDQGYLFTYQKTTAYSCAIIGKPTEPVLVGYHATPSDKVERIKEQGLRAKTASDATDRHDTIGNVYVSATFEDACWWQEHLAGIRREQHSIICVDLSSYQQVLYLDPFSQTGYAIRADIAREYIRTKDHYGTT